MHIGIIGAGEMGSSLASKFVRSGHRVSIANSRGPATLKQIGESTGAEAVTVEEAVKGKDVVVVAIPQKSIPDLPASVFAGLPANVAVIDTGNYYPNLRDGVLPDLNKSGIDSLWVQQQLGVPIVKVFNSILATSINEKGKRRGEQGRVAVAVSGNPTGAKEVVFRLLDELGFDAFDIGGIELSWKQQPGSPIYCRDHDLVTLAKKAEALGNSWDEMRSVILGKRAADEVIMRDDYTAYLRRLEDLH